VGATKKLSGPFKEIGDNGDVGRVGEETRGDDLGEGCLDIARRNTNTQEEVRR